ncbi:MAG: lamin tail domain-containing protein [Actinomycetota bacterium]|nr:lamin tail domain-containing protein [Actinomycetota bacterium]
MTTVVDGDTIEVLLPGGTQEPVRLIGINAPEEDECLAPEATAFLADLVGGEQVALEADVSDRDQFGRLLRYVYLGDVLVNEVLVREGYAIARRYEPDTALAEVLEAAQADAQQRQAGMWSPAACGPAGASSLQIVEVVADAPGDDNHNLNGEWVTIENSGTSPVDLSGWVLKDESAGHRFGFPAGFVLLAGERVSVHSGCGTDGSRKLYWCNQGSAVWNNSGDTAFLLDPSGNIAASRSYGRPPTSAAPTTVATPATAATAGRSACDSSYPDVCVAPYPPDLDCGEITHRRFRVIQPDPHGFDGEGDGVGCES